MKSVLYFLAALALAAAQQRGFPLDGERAAQRGPMMRLNTLNLDSPRFDQQSGYGRRQMGGRLPKGERRAQQYRDYAYGNAFPGYPGFQQERMPSRLGGYDMGMGGARGFPMNDAQQQRQRGFHGGMRGGSRGGVDMHSDWAGGMQAVRGSGMQYRGGEMGVGDDLAMAFAHVYGYPGGQRYKRSPRAGPGGPGRRGFGGRDPPFLKDASEETKKQVQTIISNRDLSRSAKDAMIGEIMLEESETVQASWKSFLSDQSARRERMESDHAAAVAKLSPAAQEADKQLVEQLKDESLSPSVRKEKMKAIFAGLSDDVKKELRSIRKGMKGGRVGEDKENRKNGKKDKKARKDKKEKKGKKNQEEVAPRNFMQPGSFDYNEDGVIEF